MNTADADSGPDFDVCGTGIFDTEEALKLAKNLARNCGYHVFPCRSNKRPACPHGFHDASIDAEAIDALWRRHPAPLIGVATGERSGIDVLDLDIKHSEVAGWWRQHQQHIPPTRTFRTRSGGLHLFFRHGEGLDCSAGRIAAGIDTRGNGGYVIHWFAAGWPCLDHSPPAEWPSWLLHILRPEPRPAMQPGWRANAYHERDIEAIISLVATAPVGERNRILFWASARCAERVRIGRMTKSDVEALLLSAALAAGLSEIEARRTITSGLKP